MVKNKIILLVLYLLQFYLTSLWGKQTNSQEPEPLGKKNQEREPEPLEKSQEPEPEPEPLKN